MVYDDCTGKPVREKRWVYMNKIKVTTKDKQILIVIKGAKEQRILRHELETINNNGVRGLLYLEVVEKRYSFQLVYNVTGYITLQKLLAVPQTRQSFLKILASMQKTLRSIEEHHFEDRRLLLDFEKVMVNPATGEIMFVYVPLQPYDSGATLSAFLMDICSGCVFEDEADTSFIDTYVKMLSKSRNFSLVDLERYLEEQISGKKKYRGASICPRCSAEVQEDANFCNLCGAKLRGDTARNGNPVKSVFLVDDEISPEKHPKGRNTGSGDPWLHGPETWDDDSHRQELGSGCSRTPPRKTTALGSARKTRRTTALGVEETEESLPKAYLVRERTGEYILVDGDVFRIGYSPDTSDYAISDNEAISTRHARILQRNGRYYVVDMGSTNHTYVDMRMIRNQEEVEIYSGTKIRFANETFIFKIEDGR